MREEQDTQMLQRTSQLTIRGAAEARNMEGTAVVTPASTSASSNEASLADRIEPEASTSAVTLEIGDDNSIISSTQQERSLRPSQPWGLAEYGIPPPASDLQPDPAVEAKLRHFHALRAQGVYFNNSLQSNKSFRNPSILSKLVDFVNVDEKLSAMPADIWSSSHGVSPQAWAASIAERQKQESEERERAQQRGKRSAIDFSSASSSRDRPKERLATSDARSHRPKDERKHSKWDKADSSRRSEDARHGNRDRRSNGRDPKGSHRTRSRSPVPRRY